MEKEYVFLAHGVWSLGNKSVWSIAPQFEAAGLEIINYNLERTWFLEAYLTPDVDYHRAQMVALLCKDRKVNVAAHSNGCRVISLAMQKHGARFENVVFTAPAYDAKQTYPDNAFKHLYVYYSYIDFIIAAGSVLPFSKLGSMGIRGYCGQKRDNVTNIRTNKFHWQYWQNKKIREMIVKQIVGV